MKILTDKNKSVAIAAMEGNEVKRSTFCGRFTRKVIEEFLQTLKSGYSEEDAIDIHVIYAEAQKVHVMLVPMDPEDNSKCIVMSGHYIGPRGEEL